MLLTKKPSTAFCVALGGVTTALVMLLMFMTALFPMLNVAIPAYAGFLVVVVIVEAGSKWAFLTYLASAALCPIMTPNFDANLLFILFMGYYPILFVALKKIKNKPARVILKFAIFNTAMIVYAFLYQYLFLATDLFEGLERFGKFAPFILLGLANLVFVMYDRSLDTIIDLYMHWFRKKILKRR